MDNIHDILAENARRQALLATPYDQIHGTGCAGDRVPEPPSPYNEGHSMVPRPMTADPAYAGVDSRAAYVRLRCRYDFEYWAATVVIIKDKLTGRRYVAAVDIGGRSQRSDYSVVVVLDATDSTMPEVVAQWRGHVDHDILAWKAASIGIYYNKALLAYESNTLECENTDGDPGSYILEQVAVDYPRLYYRHSPVDGVSTYRPGFHTNRSTKSMLISNLIATLRDDTYIERDAGACAEYAVYEQRPDGSFGARPGNHDDMLMARAIALYAAASGQ